MNIKGFSEICGLRMGARVKWLIFADPYVRILPMDQTFYQELSRVSLQGEALGHDRCQAILTSPDIDLLSLIAAAFEVRKHYWGREVTIHIINNVQNGQCSEDCHYCAQSRSSKAKIETYPMKTDEEILGEAESAYKSGAFRYCMVASGKAQGPERIRHLAQLVREIKQRYPIEVCVSPGFVNADEAKILKDAGLDRLNHNLNTSADHYSSICTTHSFAKRLETLQAARKVGLDMCSGVIIGMGESAQDVIQAAMTLRSLEHVKSIPVNFLLPIDGNVLTQANELTPSYCLRVLCLYRFLNPKAEIRIAAGREYHLRDMQVLGLYPANSIFMDGYLNVRGTSRLKTLTMIRDAGFTIKSEQNLEELIEKERQCDTLINDDSVGIQIKKHRDLHSAVGPKEHK